jgi:hypothetical protein
MTTIEEALALVAGLTSEQIRAFMATQLASQEAVSFETMTAGVSHEVLVLVSARALVRRWRTEVVSGHGRGVVAT